MILLFTSHFEVWVGDNWTLFSDLPDRADATRCLMLLLKSLKLIDHSKR